MYIYCMKLKSLINLYHIYKLYTAAKLSFSINDDLNLFDDSYDTRLRTDMGALF